MRQIAFRRPPRTLWQKVTRIVQLVTGVHRIHHIRWAYGWRPPFTSWCYFPAFTAADYSIEANALGNVRTVANGWQRCDRRDYHDCTKAGR